MKLLVITGGRHPYEESTPILENFLKSAGHDVTVTEDASVMADEAGMSAYDALVFNTRRENAADFAEMKLSEATQNGIMNTTVPTPYHNANNGAANFYWRNEGNREFSEATEEAGFAADNAKFSLAMHVV